MAINFPDSPTNGQSATLGGNTWTYNSTSGAWARASSAGGSSITTYDSTTDLPLSGVDAGDQAFVTGSNRMYVSNGTGWYSVSLVNTNPSITSVLDSDGGATPFTLATDGAGTVITVTASDPEDVPLTYNYSVTFGSLTNGGGTTATVVQGTDSDVNKFTITPTTTEAYAGTFELTFTASDGINQGTSVNSFTLQFITIIANSNYTTLLATAVDTSDNNNITDTSTNNHSITVTGDAHAGTFSPYRSGGYSTYFDGAGDYIDTGLNNVATDFTFECWVNTTTGGMLMARYVSGSALDGFIINSTSGVPVIQINSNTNNLNGTVDLRDGKWHHLAFVRDSNVCKIFVDGVLDVSQTDSEAMQVNANWIIGRHGNNASYYYSGYIRDLRWIAGTARYTGNFTPPTEPLTTLSGDNLFTCHLPYIIDGSATPYTMTSYGDVSTKPFSPYDYNEYSATDHGGSINFDGTGDYLTIPDHSSLNFASNDWTIECWIYPRTNVGDCGIWHQSASGGLDWFGIYLDGSFNPKFVLKNNNSTQWDGTAASNTAPQNTWTHIALVRQFGTGVYLYAGGTLVASDTGDASVAMEDKTYNHVIGYERFVGNGSAFDGLISDFKMDIGTAHYTGEFTPPTVPLSSSGTALHIKGTDASIIDKSQSSNLNLFGNTTGSTTTNFTGAKSIDLTGSNDYLVAESEDILTQDYTIETWIYAPSGGFTATGYVFDTRPQTSTQNGISLYMNSNTAYLRINGGTKITSGTTLSDQNWHHVALSRSGSNTKLFFNGSQTGSTYTVLDSILSPKFFLGIQSYNASAINGVNAYLQDFRITVGKAHYTANFTPPTASLEG